MTITVNIPADFAHHAAIYLPRAINPDPQPRYGIILPESDVFAGCRRNNRGGINASSTKPPVIMIGDGTYQDANKWQGLCERAARWRIPLDVLLTGRPLKIACTLWTPNGRFATGHEAVNIVGMQILGDLTKSAILDERVAEAKAWFTEGNE